MVCRDLGVHIDGFIATAAQTLVVQSDTDAVVTGRTADALAAAALCFEAALRLMRPGKKISDVSAPLQQIAEEHGVTLVEGVLSHQLKQFVIDGNKCVLNKPTPEAKVRTRLSQLHGSLYDLSHLLIPCRLKKVNLLRTRCTQLT